MPLDVVVPNDNDPFAKYNTPNSPILFPVGERSVGWEMRNHTWARTRGHKAIIRLSPDATSAQLLNIVGSSYKLVHNRELFTRVEQTMVDRIMPEQLTDVRVTDRVSGYGRVCYRDYVFPSIRCKLPGTRSDIAFRLIVQNGYGGSALRIHVGAIDFYCSNGMVRGDYTTTYRKHTSGLVIDSVDDVVAKALLMFSDSEQLWSGWAKKPVKHSQAMELFHEIARSKKMRDGLANQYLREVDERGETLWAVYSALTYFASHNDGDFALKSTVYDQDSVASTMLQRELDVSKWVQTDKWKQMEEVA